MSPRDTQAEAGGQAGLPVGVARHIGALSERISTLSGWRRRAAALMAGSLSVLAFAPVHLSPVLFLTLPVLVWLIDGAGRSGGGQGGSGSARSAVLRAAAAGWWFGFGFFLLGLFWIGEAFLVEAEVFAWLLPVAVTLMPAGLALFFAAACGAARAWWPEGIARVLVLAVAVAVTEWLRGHILTGFPWNALGYALAFPLPLLQAASLVGVDGMTIWVLPVFGTPLAMLAGSGQAGPEGWRQALAGVALLTVLPLLAALSYGAMRLARPAEPRIDGVRLRIVQPSIPQREKWQRDKQRRNFDLHLELSRTAADGRRDDLAGITHLVWPEAAMPFLPLETPAVLEELGALLPRTTYLLTGALRLEAPREGAGAAPVPNERRRAYNSFMVFGPGGGLAALYDKIHLVPFGEYLPLQTALESIGLEQLTRWRGGFSSGVAPRPLLDIPGLPRTAALVCYEAIFPSEVAQGAERPGVLVNLTNDGWFGTMTGPYQHLQQARARAVEQGLPLIRAANNGVSAIFDAEGRQLASLGLNVRGVIDGDLPRARPPTLYARLGDRVLMLEILLFIGTATLLRRGRIRREA